MRATHRKGISAPSRSLTGGSLSPPVIGKSLALARLTRYAPALGEVGLFSAGNSPDGGCPSTPLVSGSPVGGWYSTPLASTHLIYTHSPDWTHLMRITRALTIPALALALLAGGTAANAAANLTHQSIIPSVNLSQADRCEEDESCWDCETMGNQICGLPDIQANAAQRLTAWAAWDNQGGWTQLRVDPSREVRVDVLGYSLTPPKGHFSLKADDGLWYVFTAH